MWLFNFTEVEGAVNSIISLILIVPLENNEGLVTALCEKLAKTQSNDKKNMARLRLLTNLFHGLDDRSAHRCIVYTSLLRMAGTADLMHHVNPSLETVSEIVASVFHRFFVSEESFVCM